MRFRKRTYVFVGIGVWFLIAMIVSVVVGPDDNKVVGQGEPVDSGSSSASEKLSTYFDLYGDNPEYVDLIKRLLVNLTKVTELLDMPLPENSVWLREFVGAVDQNRQFSIAMTETTPPPGTEDLHVSFTLVSEQYDEGLHLYQASLSPAIIESGGLDLISLQADANALFARADANMRFLTKQFVQDVLASD